MGRVLPLAGGSQVCEGAPCGDASVGDAVVGALLRAAREQAGASPAQAAAYAGLRESRLTRLEAAQVRWAREHAVALARWYGMPAREVEELGHLLVAGHQHAVPDYGAIPGPRLGALESRAVRIRVATQTVPPFVYGWARPEAAGPSAGGPRPWPSCPVTLIWDDLTLDRGYDDLTLDRGYMDAPRTAARLRHLAALVDAEVLSFRLLIPDKTFRSNRWAANSLSLAGPLCASVRSCPWWSTATDREPGRKVHFSTGNRLRRSALRSLWLPCAARPKGGPADDRPPVRNDEQRPCTRLACHCQPRVAPAAA
ncbi:helix-turn-helix domain-containing protein [Streptomyces longwoodensis]|uniref:helix-turn-helix domain-containing protein n=1 Tax=Streptomyces longwoodensis TaxID=68231 RepID=UPI0033ACD53A